MKACTRSGARHIRADSNSGCCPCTPHSPGLFVCIPPVSSSALPSLLAPLDDSQSCDFMVESPEDVCLSFHVYDKGHNNELLGYEVIPMQVRAKSPMHWPRLSASTFRLSRTRRSGNSARVPCLPVARAHRKSSHPWLALNMRARACSARGECPMESSTAALE